VYFSTSKISRIENARVAATVSDVRTLLDVYDADVHQRDQLLKIAREARQKGWWQQAYGDLPIGELVGLESAAASISQFSSLLVPALLQTADYARAVLRAVELHLPPREIDRRVELRMARQSMLDQENSPVLWVVLDEAALRRTIGGTHVMRAQVDRLREALMRPNVTIQVLPFESGENAGLNGEFTIIRFPDPVDPGVVYVEGNAQDLYMENIDAVQRYELLFDHLRAQALNPAASAAFMAEAPLSVFISYSHRDKDIAHSLAARLAKMGVRTWVDEGELRIGDSLVERISKAISEVEFVVALVSKNSVESKWCQRELSWAMSGELQQRGIRILPLRVGEVEMPTTLSHVFYLNVDPNNLEAAVARLVADASSHHAEKYGIASRLQRL
jgi:predicted nucleotide-binding protein